ncbi:hypothetical protein chiPu_0026782 [Chiloscyllium punctatum]|uniref:Uncharacterized protein n=1 Tax=Chiloscyllium punctatum TaxID=137246 RepID=A0A401TJD1_CHIPU|nr:hypothetical protein [Chiloscyllium punctatum]
MCRVSSQWGGDLGGEEESPLHTARVRRRRESRWQGSSFRANGQPVGVFCSYKLSCEVEPLVEASGTPTKTRPTLIITHCSE